MRPEKSKEKTIQPYWLRTNQVLWNGSSWPKIFYPVDASNARILDENHYHSYWYELFKNSVAVHFSAGTKLFHGHLTEKGKEKLDSRNKRYLRQKITGKCKPAMSFVGSKECPLSFFSIRPLWKVLKNKNALHKCIFMYK